MTNKKELGVKKTPLTAITIGIAGTFLGISTKTLTLNQGLLLIIAISTTSNAILGYFNQEVKH